MSKNKNTDLSALANAEIENVGSELVEQATSETSSEWITLYDSIASDEEVRQLHPRKIRAINLYLSGLYTLKQISNLLGCTENTITNWLKEQNIQTVIQAMQEREYKFMESYLQSLRTRAINGLSDLMESENEGIKLNAVKEVLKATGMSNPVQKVQIEKKIENVEMGMKNIVDIDAKDIKVNIDDILTEVKNG